MTNEQIIEEYEKMSYRYGIDAETMLELAKAKITTCKHNIQLMDRLDEISDKYNSLAEEYAELIQSGNVNIICCESCCHWNETDAELEDEQKGIFRCYCNEIDMMTLPSDYCSFSKAKLIKRKGV